ncbi:hypothetical protein BGZ58_002372, partial [Dissophora ornata]
MTAGSGAPSTSAAAASNARLQTGRRTATARSELHDTNMDSVAPPPPYTAVAAAAAGPSSSSSAHQEPPHIAYPRTLVASIKPTIGAHIPHLDYIKKGLQYITESTVEYEEFYGNKSNKTAGLKDPPSSSSASQTKKPVSRSKASLAAQAEKEAFSEDPQIHEMEEALLSVLEMQRRIEVERQALENLSSIVSVGGRLPGKDLHASFEQLRENEIKHAQTRRKQEQKYKPTPGGIDHELFEMRKKIWEVHHDTDPLPNSGATSGGAGEEEGDEDMEVMVTAGAGVQSLKCPITTNYLEDPVTSSVCKHSFSKEAI